MYVVHPLFILLVPPFQKVSATVLSSGNQQLCDLTEGTDASPRLWQRRQPGAGFAL